MRPRQALAVAALVVVATALALPVAAADSGVQETEDETNESSLGEQVTAFMQSTAAQTNDSVDDGMWKAAFQHANESERARMVHNRTGHLEQRIETLQDLNRTVQSDYENGSMPESVYLARSSRIEGQIQALRAAVAEAQVAASDAGVNETRLAQLRADADGLRGPEVAGIARDLADDRPLPPDQVPVDGPEARGNASNESDVNAPAGGGDDKPGNDDSGGGDAGANTDD